MNKRIVYRNYDLKTIGLLMREIGRHRYEQALENMKVIQRPITMEGWYVEADEFSLKLCHRYPGRSILKLMDVDGYNNIPRQGWERIKTE